MRTNSLDWLSLLLVITGAINWGLIGLFDYNLVANVASIFGDAAETVARLVYILVGLAGLYLLYTAYKMAQDRDVDREVTTT